MVKPLSSFMAEAKRKPKAPVQQAFQFSSFSPSERVPEVLTTHLQALDGLSAKEGQDFSHHQGWKMLDATRRAIAKSHKQTPITFTPQTNTSFLSGSYDPKNGRLSVSVMPKEMFTTIKKKERPSHIGAAYMVLGHELGHHFDHVVKGGALSALMTIRDKSDFSDAIREDGYRIHDHHAGKIEIPSGEECHSILHNSGFTIDNLGSSRFVQLAAAIKSHKPLEAARVIGNNHTSYALEDSVHAATGILDGEGLSRPYSITHSNAYYNQMGQIHDNPSGNMVRECETVANVHAAVHGMGQKQSSFLMSRFFPSTSKVLLGRLSSV